MAELYIVRHAQASFESEDYDRLSGLGHRQSVWLGEYFAAHGLVFDGFLTGTLRRHHETLAGICAGMAMDVPPGIRSVAGFDEYDFRGLVHAFCQDYPDEARVLAWRANPGDKHAFYRVLKLALLEWSNGAFEGRIAESWDDFRERAAQAIDRAREFSASCGRMLAVCSSGAMATMLGVRLALSVPDIIDLNMQVRNTAVSHFYVNRQRFLLASWNVVPHLDAPERAGAITYG